MTPRNPNGSEVGRAAARGAGDDHEAPRASPAVCGGMGEPRKPEPRPPAHAAAGPPAAKAAAATNVVAGAVTAGAAAVADLVAEAVAARATATDPASTDLLTVESAEETGPRDSSI